MVESWPFMGSHEGLCHLNLSGMAANHYTVITLILMQKNVYVVLIKITNLI